MTWQNRRLLKSFLITICDELKTQLWFGVMARVMKHIYTKDILPYFKSVILDLRHIEKNGDLDYIYTIISYLFEAAEIQDKTEFIDTIKTGLSDNEEKIMTLAEQFREEGRTEAQNKIMTLAEQFRAEGRADSEATLRRIALKMLNEGLDAEKVSKFTEIPEKDLYELLAKTKN